MMINHMTWMCFGLESALVWEMTNKFVDGYVLDSIFQHLAKNEKQMRNVFGK